MTRKLTEKDTAPLQDYFRSLDDKSKAFFSPHPLTDEVAMSICCGDDPDTTGYVLIEEVTNQVVAYSVVTKTIRPNDVVRLESAGIKVTSSDRAIAPSVAKAWQGKGLAHLLLNHTVSALKAEGVKRIFLWGGVEAKNENAMRFYESAGFKSINSFVRNGSKNWNMVLFLQ